MRSLWVGVCSGRGPARAFGLAAALLAAATAAAGCGDDAGQGGGADAGPGADGGSEPQPEDLEPGSYLAPLVKLQRLQGVEDHMHIDDVRLREDDLLLYCSYTFGVIDASDAHAMSYLSQNLKHTIPGDERRPGCIHVSWDDTDPSIVYTSHRGNIRNPAFLSGWDISDPTAPVQIPVLQEPGTSYEDIDVLGGYIFVGLKEEGLGVYTRDPTTNSFTRVATLTGLERAWGVRARDDGIVFVSDNLGGLVAVDATDPLSPSIISRVVTGGQARDAVIDGDIVYVATGSAGVTVVDASDLSNMQVVTRISMPGSAIRVAHSDDLLFVAAWNDARVYDVSDPANPRFIGAARVTQRDDDITDPDRPESTMRVFGIDARGTDMFMGSWWVPHSYRVYPERTAPSIRLPETYMQTDFGPVPVGSQKTLPLEVTNQGQEPLTIVSATAIGPFEVEPRQLRVAPGETATLQVTFTPTRDEMEAGYLKILSDDPAEPLRTAYLVGNLPGLGVGQVLPETRAILLDGTEWSSSQVQEKVLLLSYFATF